MWERTALCVSRDRLRVGFGLSNVRAVEEDRRGAQWAPGIQKQWKYSVCRITWIDDNQRARQVWARQYKQWWCKQERSTKSHVVSSGKKLGGTGDTPCRDTSLPSLRDGGGGRWAPWMGSCAGPGDSGTENGTHQVNPSAYRHRQLGQD